MDLLEPVLFTDAWGSHVSIASLQGRAIPSAEPESELWMGAHESGPCGITRDGVATTLADVIRAGPGGRARERCAADFEGRLPFLLKVLAPGRAISIQAHPTAEQARAVRERDREPATATPPTSTTGPSPSCSSRSRPSRSSSACAPPTRSASLAKRLAVPRLTALVEAAARRARPGPRPARLDPRRPRRTSTPASSASSSPPASGSRPARDDEGHQCAAIAHVAEDHPDDIGIAVLLLMYHRVLEPGDYIDVPAGVLHSYVSGLGIEVLANSDNVVRAGLTSKQIDVPELLRIVDPDEDGCVGHAEPDPDLPATERFPSQSDRFALRRLQLPRPTSSSPATARRASSSASTARSP